MRGQMLYTYLTFASFGSYLFNLKYAQGNSGIFSTHLLLLPLSEDDEDEDESRRDLR